MAKLYIKNTDGTFAPHSSIAVTKLDVVQGKGNSLTSAMSQKAVTDELATKQNALTDTDGGYGQRVTNLEKEGIASQEKLTELEVEQGNRLDVIEQRLGVSESFEADAAGSEYFHFIKGGRYTIYNNGSSSVNYSTRLSENGSTLDGVFTIPAGGSHTFVASSEAYYLRHNLGTSCAVVRESDFAKSAEVKKTFFKTTASRLQDGTYYFLFPNAVTEATEVTLTASVKGFLFARVLPADGWTPLASYKWDGDRIRITLPATAARMQVAQNGSVSGDVVFDLEYADTLNERLVNTESGIEQNRVDLSVAMFDSIGAIGDSFTIASVYHLVDGNPVYYRDFPEHSPIAVLSKRNGVPYVNYGIGGSTSKSWMSEPLGYAKFQADDKCSFYFLAHGLNDQAQIAGGQLSLGTISDIGTATDSFYGNYSRLVASVMAAAPNAKLCAIKLQLYDYSLGVVNVNKAIEDIADYYGIMCINPLDDDFFKSTLFNTQIGGHPTCGGYCGMGMAYERLLSKEMMSHTEYLLDANF